MSNDDKNKDKAKDGAVRAEAEGATTVDFEFDGETWTVPTGDHWPREAGIAYAEIVDSADAPARSFKYVDKFIAALLGPADHRRFTRKPGRTTGDVNAMYRAIFDAYGVTSGE